MERELSERIRERAYEIWTANGCCEGEAEQHWLAAEREILARSAAPLSAQSAGIAAKATASRSAAKMPRAKKARA